MSFGFTLNIRKILFISLHNFILNILITMIRLGRTHIHDF